MMKKLFISLCMAVLLTAMVVIPSVHAEEMDIQSLPFHSIEGFIVNEPETFASLVERARKGFWFVYDLSLIHI